MLSSVKNSITASLILFLTLPMLTGCLRSSAGQRYFGVTKVPSDNVFRYITGSEPESLDPQFVNGQPEARIMMALYEGLVEYHPISLEPIPAIASSWEVSPDGTEYLFKLRPDARFSNGDPIRAGDFVYSFRRGLSPEYASRNAALGYYLKYAEAFNSKQAFVRNADGSFVLKASGAAVEKAPAGQHNFGPDTESHRALDAPERLTVPADEAARKKLTDKDAALKASIEGKTLVPVQAEDIGVEAVDDHTVRLKLQQSAPFFLGLLAHQFFKVVHRPSIERHGAAWTKAANIVTSGPFKVARHRPYDVLSVVKDPNYWDAANVKLAGIDFYPLDEQTTMLNLYNAGEVHATYNHTIPAAWNETIRQYKAEYSLHPEVVVDYYSISVKKPPMDNVKVRRAFSLAIDREALALFQRTKKALVDFTPEGIFPRYEAARQRVYKELLTAQGSSLEEWKARKFDPEKARKLLAEAGYPVERSGSGWVVPSFPIDKVSLTYNTSESNQKIAEFIQAQWKQNLGITVPLKNMEFKTYLPYIQAVEYEGIVRNGWSGDYMDPFTFLSLFYSQSNYGSTGWWDPKYDKMLDDANKEVDPIKRYEMLARAEFYMMQEQIVIPLCTAGTSWMKKPFVKGMYPNPGTLHAWKFVYLEPDQSKWTADMDTIMSENDPVFQAQLAAAVASQENVKPAPPAAGDTE